MCTPQVGLEPTQGCCSSSIQANASINFAIATYDVHGIQEKRGSFITLFSILTNLKKINPFYSVLLLSLLRSLNGTQGIFCLSNGFYSFLYGRLSIYITRKLKNLLSVYEADIFAKLSYTLNEVKVIGVLGGLSILVDYFVSKICLYKVLKRFLAFCLRSTKTCA